MTGHVKTKRITKETVTALFSMRNLLLIFAVLLSALPQSLLLLQVSFFATLRGNKVRKLILLAGCTITLVLYHGAEAVPSVAALLLFYLVEFYDKAFVYKNKFIRGAFAGLSIFVSGLYYVIKADFIPFAFVRLLFFSLCAMFFCYIFDYGIPILIKGAKRRYLSNEEMVSLAFIGVLAILLVPESWNSLNLRMILSCALVLFFSAKGRVSYGAVTGVICGIALGWNQPDMFSMCGVLGLCGLLASVGRKFTKIGVCLAFVLGCGISWNFAANVTDILISPFDVVYGCFLFSLIPNRVYQYFALVNRDEPVETNKFAKMASERLRAVANAIHELYETNLAMRREKENTADLGTLFDKTADKVCTGCKMRLICWEREFNDTYDAFSHIVRGIARGEDAVPDYFRTRCVKIAEITEWLSLFYEDYREKMGYQQLVASNQEAFSSQLNDISSILQSIADDIKLSTDEAKRFDLCCELDREDYTIYESNVYRNSYGRYEVELVLRHEQDLGKLRNIVSDVIGKEMAVFKFDTILRKVHVMLCEAKIYRLETAACAVCKDGEVVSGDSFETIQMKDGKTLIALSDGMGYGEEAGKQSQEVIKLLTRLLGAGFHKDTAVKIINSTLVSNNRDTDDTYSTIDLALVDLTAGTLEIVKNGASTSFIKKHKGVKKIENRSLPAGVFNKAEPDVTKYVMEDGDYLVMMSDGIPQAFSSEEELYQLIDKISSKTPADQFANLILEESLKRYQKKAEDDMTVIVGRLKQNKGKKGDAS